MAYSVPEKGPGLSDLKIRPETSKRTSAGVATLNICFALAPEIPGDFPCASTSFARALVEIPCLEHLEFSYHHSNFLDFTFPFMFEELISVIFTPPITPNKFWGFTECNTQENVPTLSCPYSEKLNNLLHQNILRE